MSLRFGTSGVRGLVSEMSDYQCWLFTRAFVRHARTGSVVETVGISGDLRASTHRILRSVALALEDEGVRVVYCGRVPTPVLCLYGLVHRIPTVMVTGSHIPEDRNGIKFNLATGEILKEDEAGILEHHERLGEECGLPFGPFDSVGQLNVDRPDLPGIADEAASREYLRRYLEFFPEAALRGQAVGLYEHSSVGRDLLCELLEGLGAVVTRLGRSDSFVAVDTEAVQNPEQLAHWVRQARLDALVSTDGDADRPLLVADDGRVVHGDILGTLVADYLGAEAVVLPVSCNTAVERWERFPLVRRTRIGSPYVVAGMLECVAAGRTPVVGFEANGGFLIASEIAGTAGRRPLAPLPTRDAALPLLAALHMAHREGLRVSELPHRLPDRQTWSGLVRQFPAETGREVISLLRRMGLPPMRELFGDALGPGQRIDFTDGARITFGNGEIVHFRPSGNAPEFRCYTEAQTLERARRINDLALEVLVSKLRPQAEETARSLSRDTGQGQRGTE